MTAAAAANATTKMVHATAVVMFSTLDVVNVGHGSSSPYSELSTQSRGKVGVGLYDIVWDQKGIDKPPRP